MLSLSVCMHRMNEIRLQLRLTDPSKQKLADVFVGEFHRSPPPRGLGWWFVSDRHCRRSLVFPRETRLLPRNGPGVHAGLVFKARFSVFLFSILRLVPHGFETPDKNPRGLQHPGQRNIPFEDVYFKTADGVTLHGWLLLQPASKEVPTFLFFHGNAGNIGFRLPNLELLYHLVKVNILIVAYRGYGFSEGHPTEEGIYKDAEGALNFISENSAVSKKNIFVFGRSIGGAVAVECARRRGVELKGIIVENTFTSLIDMLYVVFPFLRPFHFLIRLVQRMYMQNDKKVRLLNVPVLFISGRQDELVPPSHMDRLFELCLSPLKLRADIKGGGHNDTWEIGGKEYYEKIREFVELALSNGGNSVKSGVQKALASPAVSQTSTAASVQRRQRLAVDKDL
ncbi:hypothetical protein Efla_000080 [Eimeria flavescens]